MLFQRSGEETVSAKASRERPLVLVVDDEEEHCKLLEIILRRDYAVGAAQSGRAALAFVEERRPDVILADFRMPGMNGIELFEKLIGRDDEGIRFLVSAYSDSSFLQEAINRGQVYRFLPKPVDGDLLRLDIQRALEHRDANMRLRQAEKMAAIGQLAGSVVHDLRNSLQAIALVPALLRLGGEADIAQSLALATAASRDMGDLVAELLALAKGDVPKYQVAEHSLVSIAHEVVQMCVADPMFSERPIHERSEGAIPPVMVSASRCRRLLHNLLRNAAQATTPGCSISVAVYLQHPNYVVLEVGDTGRGMSPDVARRLAQPFFTTKGESGVGLGLFICRTVMEAHGGTLEWESTLGRGTVFKAMFPAG